MPNKQIHDLPPMDIEEFRPARDNFIVQKPNGMTTRSDIGNMIDDPSVNLPGSTNWNWNFLDKPATIVPYHKIDYGLPAFDDLPLTAQEKDIPTSSSIGYPNLKNISYEYDAITKKPTGIPKNAKSLMCVAFLSNCDLHLIGPRTTPLISSQRLPPFYTDGIGGTSGWNSKPIEGIFIVDNISRPKSSNVNQNTPDKTIEYMDPNTLSFELQFRLGTSGWVSFGGSYSLSQAIGNVFQGIANIGGSIYTGIDRLTGFLPNFNIGGAQFGVDFRDSYAGQAINAFGGLVDSAYSALGNSKALDTSSSKTLDQMKEILNLPLDGFKKATDILAKSIEDIPIIGTVLSPLIGSRQGMDLIADRLAMAQLLNDPSFFYDHFVKREVILQYSEKRSVAGWELFYIKVIAWN